MVLPARVGHRRAFVDARDDGRQMEVTWHEQAGVVVISFWQGERCQSTFQMPIEEAPALIGVLTSALGDAVSGRRRGPPGPALERRRRFLDGPPFRRDGRSFLSGWFRRLSPRRSADVVPLRAVPRNPWQ